MTTADTSRLLGRLDLPAHATAASQARRYVGDLLRAADHPAAEGAEPLVTEPVANVIRHSDSQRPGGRVRVEVRDQCDGTIRIEVTDDGSTTNVPRLRPLGDNSEGGRGLLLVNASAIRWGHHQQNSHRSPRRTVWCDLPIALSKDDENELPDQPQPANRGDPSQGR